MLRGEKMENRVFLESFVDNDLASIVMCDLNFTVVYMNKAAKEEYKSYGGESLVGASLLSVHNPECMFKITEVVHWFSMDKGNNIIRTFYNEKKNSDLFMQAIRDKDGELIGFTERQERRNKDNISFYQF